MSPRILQKMLAYVSPNHEPDWAGLRQQDAHELLVALLERLQVCVVCVAAARPR